ncbi:MAG: arginine deiminase-related protein [Fermentimonas sp.]|nr:arginine deiminase-related protein [Fermentimonas sp.]MDD4009696.1 arginine deiminase-related protein [Fermentimonas sp.]
MQTTSKLLMVRPARFAFNDETAKNNFFQKKTVLSEQESEQDRIAEDALKEFDAFVKLLKANDVDVTVVQDTPEPHTPDSIFPNNWFSSHFSGELVLYPMFAPNRRLERKSHILNLLKRNMNHRKVVDLTFWENEGEFLEGTGSMVFDRRKKIAYCCRSPRTSEKVLNDFCSRMNFQPVVFDAVDKDDNKIYHTNVMMEIGMQVAVICLESIKDEYERKRVISQLNSTGKIIVDISLDQVSQFAGNMLEVKSRNGNPLMIMSASAHNSLTASQENIISTYNKIVTADLDTIEKNGGGSARCMLAEIFY